MAEFDIIGESSVADNLKPEIPLIPNFVSSDGHPIFLRTHDVAPLKITIHVNDKPYDYYLVDKIPKSRKQKK